MLALLLSLMGYRYFQSQSPHPLLFQTANVERGPIAAKVTASGAVSAIVTIQVGSQVSGRIEHWYADFGVAVKKGELIATIEPSLFEATVVQAKANLASSKAMYDKATANRQEAERTRTRSLALFNENLLARADLDLAAARASAARADVEAAGAAVQQAHAALDQAALGLSYTRILSPIDGIVISRNIDVGQTVAASFQSPTLFTIAQDLTKMQVDTNVAESDDGKIHEKMEATFTVDAYPTRVFRGVVRQVRDNATTIQNVVTYDAVIDIDNSDLALRPTMTANCAFPYARKDDVVRIPNAALRFNPDSTTIAAMTGAPAQDGDKASPDQRLVWLLRSGRAVPKRIRTGIGDGVMTEVAEGDVRAGDVAVTGALPVGASASKKGP
ncbi:MAG: efflux RND transporter periplasmic adaptor subunit [Polyangiaceae bacterium]